MIAIADLGIGNFAAISNMVTQLGGDARRVIDPHGLNGASRVILPGVGSFAYAASALDEGGWREPLTRIFEEGSRPVLCVCVGMQLLVESSAEGDGSGLGWIAGACARLEPDPAAAIKVPHMGWNEVVPTRSSAIFPAGPTSAEPERFYFVHSYQVRCTDPEDVWATTNHGSSVTAAIGRDNVIGVQFHPEKSHRFGLALLRRFLEIPC